MTNHYQLSVETPDANLSKGMRHLNGSCIQLVNRRCGRLASHLAGFVRRGLRRMIFIGNQATRSAIPAGSGGGIQAGGGAAHNPRRFLSRAGRVPNRNGTLGHRHAYFEGRPDGRRRAGLSRRLDGDRQFYFASSLQPAIRREHIRALLQVYRDAEALVAIGEALVRHLGRLHAGAPDLPSPDNLETWASAWKDAGRDIDALRLPLRIFRTGVDFLKAGGTDRGILLDLNQEECRLLEQAFGLESAA